MRSAVYICTHRAQTQTESCDTCFCRIPVSVCAMNLSFFVECLITQRVTNTIVLTADTKNVNFFGKLIRNKDVNVTSSITFSQLNIVELPYPSDNNKNKFSPSKNDLRWNIEVTHESTPIPLRFSQRHSQWVPLSFNDLFSRCVLFFSVAHLIDDQMCVWTVNAPPLEH